MALQSNAVTLESHAALAEIRDTLLETYASNDAMNQLILANLDPRAWRAQPPGEKGSGRTIAAIFAHLHNCRLKWLKRSAPHLKRSEEHTSELQSPDHLLSRLLLE